MPEEIKKEIKERLQVARTDKQFWEPIWQKVIELLDPNFDDIYNKLRKGSERGDRRIYDSKGVRGLEVFVSGVHQRLFTPFTQFLEYTIKDQRRVRESKALQLWLADVSEIISDGIIASNFHAEIEPSLRALGTFGHYTQWLETYDPNDERYGEYIFMDLPVDQVFPIENRQGFVDTMIREWSRKAEHILNDPQFFNYLEQNQELRGNLDKERDKPFKLIQYITPVRPGFPMGFSRHEFANVILLEEKDQIINTVNGKLRGYQEQPFYVNRFSKRTGQTYSRSSGMSIIGETESLQQLAYWRLKAAGLATSPPVMIRRNNVTDDIKILPDHEIDVKHPDDITYLEPRSRMDVAQLESENIVQNIDRAYNVDAFAFPQDLKTMTATEAALISDSQQGQFSPMLSRMYHEHINPMSKRLFWIKFRAGEIPPPPVPLEPSELSVRVISPMAQAQNASEIVRAENFLRSVVEFAQIFPRMTQKIDPDEYVNFIAERSNKAFFSFLRSEEEVEEREQAIQAQQQLQQGAEAIKDLALAQNAQARTEDLQRG